MFLPGVVSLVPKVQACLLFVPAVVSLVLKVQPCFLAKLINCISHASAL